MMEEKVECMEASLEKYEENKLAGVQLKEIRRNITWRVEKLLDLQNEMKTLAYRLHYYDMLDYLSDLTVSTLTLSHCNGLLAEMKNAIERFTEDNNKEYLESALKLAQRIKKVAHARAKELLAEERGEYGGVSEYISICPEAYAELEALYFAARKKYLRSKISACIIDIQKNYKLVIFIEMQLYFKAFGEEVVVSSREGEQEILPSFAKHIQGVFHTVFRRVKTEAVKEILQGISQEGYLKTDPESVFSTIAYLHYGTSVLPSENVQL